MEKSMIITWECCKCTKKNHYSKSTNKEPELLLEWKTLTPNREKVVCKYCGEEQTIELSD